MTAIFAHRGASRDHPENTLAAFRGAVTAGADGVELDVRRSADGQAVVHHDAYLPDGRLICALPQAELPAWLPDLRSALEACVRIRGCADRSTARAGKFVSPSSAGLDNALSHWSVRLSAHALSVNVELKNAPGEEDYDSTEALATSVALFLLAESDLDRVIVSSFELSAIDAVRAVSPLIPTAWLVALPKGPVLDAAAERCAGHGHGFFHPHHGGVDERLMGRCKFVGLRVNTWTVDDPGRIKALAAMGVDGIITNVPDVARGALGRG